MATKTLANLVVRIGADVSGATVGMTSVQKASRALKKEFTGLSEATLRYRSMMVALGGTAVLGLVVKNSLEAQNATAQLQAVLQSTGGAAGKSMADLNALAASLQRTTIYSDEATKGAEGLLLTFTKIQGGTFDRATKVVLDMSVALKQDLKEGAIQVGKALQDPILGITALRRVGVNFSDSQKAVVKQLLETGQQAKAQELILKELETEFGGSAAAARNTLGGAIAYLKNQFDDFFEVSQSGSGVFINAINSMGDAVQWVRDRVMVPFFGGIQIMAADAAVAVAGLQLAISKVGEGKVTGPIQRFLGLGKGGGVMDPLGLDLFSKVTGTDASKSVADAQANFDRMKSAADDVKASIIAGGEAYVPYARNVNAASDAIHAMTKEEENFHKLLLSMSKGNALFSRPEFGLSFGDQEAMDRFRAMQMGTNRYVKAIPDTLKPMTKGFEDEAKRIEVIFGNTTDKLIGYAQKYKEAFIDSISEAVASGKFHMRDFANFVISELLRIGTKRLLTQVINAALGSVGASSTTGGASGGNSWNAGSNGIGPFGNAISSAPFNIPAPSPTIVNQNINFTVSAIDSRDAARFVQEQKGSIAGVVAEAARGSGAFRRALAGA